MELFDASIDPLHAYVLSYASANCRLAYMLLHRGICTFGALLDHHLAAWLDYSQAACCHESFNCLLLFAMNVFYKDDNWGYAH